VLVIGWKRFSQPIASMLEAMGATVDVVDEDSLERLQELKSAENIRARFDVVWLAPLDHFWKLVEPAIGDGLAEAVKQGVGFIHSGGNASFHGGAAKGAALDLTRLAEILPVAIRTQGEDVVYPDYMNNGQPAGETAIKEIHVVDPTWTDASLNQFGLSGYNQVEAKLESKVELTVEGNPLLATGQYGKGRTVAFTGFTPAWEAPGPDYLDEQFDEMPVSQAYFGIFAQMLAAATGRQAAIPWPEVLAAREKPLFQMLKEQPATTMHIDAPKISAAGNSATLALNLKNGANYARLVRMRIEWDGPQPYLSLYNDNYFDLFPGESRQVSLELSFPGKLTAPARGRLIVSGSNLEASETPITVNP
jgi:uncharacterized membrane protein